MERLLVLLDHHPIIGLTELTLIIAGIFFLILIYKVWGMTDDVKEIKKMMAEKMKQDNQPEKKE